MPSPGPTQRIAIIAPGCTDVNRGDQALVWEAFALVRDAGLADTIYLMDVGDDDAERETQSQQTRQQGHTLLRAILPHPRRGRHHAGDKVRESTGSLAGMALHALSDWLWGSLLLALAPVPALAERLLNAEQRRTYRAFRDADVLIIKGGGFLHAYGGLTAPYLIWYQLFYFRLAQRLDKPVVILPNSFGPFVGATVPGQLHAVLSRCAFVAARESISAGMLSALLGAPVPVYPDMGYGLQPAERARGEAICREAGVPLGEQPCVAFTLRPYRFPGSADPEQAYADYLAAMSALVRHAAAQGMHPVFVTHVAGPSAHENDRLAIAEARKQLGDVPHSWIDVDVDCRDLKAVYGCMDVLVGTRFHSVIFAQGGGVPCLAIAYGGNKGQGIMRDMGLGEFVINIEDVSPEALCAAFDRLVERADDVKARIAAWNARVREARSAMSAAIRAALPPTS